MKGVIANVIFCTKCGLEISRMESDVSSRLLVAMLKKRSDLSMLTAALISFDHKLRYGCDGVIRSEWRDATPAADETVRKGAYR